MKITSNSTHKMQKRQKAQNHKKKSFLKQLVENADLHKPVLNKIKTTNEQCVKYDFVAPLMLTLSNIHILRHCIKESRK